MAWPAGQCGPQVKVRTPGCEESQIGSDPPPLLVPPFTSTDYCSIDIFSWASGLSFLNNLWQVTWRERAHPLRTGFCLKGHCNWGLRSLSILGRRWLPLATRASIITLKLSAKSQLGAKCEVRKYRSLAADNHLWQGVTWTDAFPTGAGRSLWAPRVSGQGWLPSGRVA